MRIDQVILREIRLPLVHFFETSFGRVHERRVLLLEARCENRTGWGECVADEGPFFSYETVETARAVLGRFLIPQVLGPTLESPEVFPERVRAVRGHPMAKACLEAALWDLQAQTLEVPLWKLLGGTLTRVACGVSIGIQDRPEQLFEKIEKELEAGYRKIKIKIKPGWDVEIVRQVRERFPDIPLMVDANSAYSLKDAAQLGRLDAFDLLMIEQPLGYDDLVEHAALQRRLSTPICLDESIRHHRDARNALELGACRIINIKMGRVGGHTEARRIHDLCRERDVPVWCGGMLETGIGRAHNVALSTLENFRLPGDVSASRRYFHRDVIQPPVEVTPQGEIPRPEGPGLGYEVDRDWIEKLTQRQEVFG